jgi:hypothetical protein
MPGHGKFGRRSEDSHAGMGVLVFGRKKEGGLREIHLVGDVLHGRGREAAGIGKDRELVSAEAFGGEDVVVEISFHGGRR